LLQLHGDALTSLPELNDAAALALTQLQGRNRSADSMEALIRPPAVLGQIR
jgi:hypothetical protein